MRNWKVPKTSQDLVARSATVEESALADSSRRTYKQMLSVYQRVMEGMDRTPYPLTEENMRLFIEICRENNKTFSYVNLTIESFVFWFREHNCQDLTKTVAFRAYKKGLRRVLHAGQLPNAKDAVTKEMLIKWVGLADPTEDQKHCETCFAFVMMFFGFLRHSELRGLKWNDIRRDENGLRVWIRHSKTDQEYEGREFVLPKRKDEIDPMTWFQFYLIWNSGEESERVWHHSPNWLRNQVKIYAAYIQLPGERFGCHSFRKGGAHAAFQAGIPDCAIKVHGRWKSEAYQRYTSVSAMEAALRIGTEL